ncbi:MAG: hypothetical protein EXR91_08690 [Gemmatimonadetes bacterium]|nr:hypothetical protein [Gemmatimonadota bacterium]
MGAPTVRWRVAAAVPLLVVLAASCGGGVTREATIVLDSAGVTIVDNDDAQPAWTLETTWRLSPRPRIQVGNQPGNPDQMLYRAAHTRRLSDGGIAVANGGMGDVRVFDAGGYHVTTIGFVLDPTVEAPRPQRVYPIPGDSLLVYLTGGGLSLWDPQYRLRRESQIVTPEAPFEGELEPAGVFDDGTMLILGRLPPDAALTGLQRSTMRPMRFGADGRMIDSFGDFPDETEIMGDEVHVFGPTGHVAAADSTIWYTSSETYELREIARGGRTLRIVRLDRPLPPVTGADLGAFRVAAVRQMSDDVGKEAAEATVDSYEYAEVFPTFGQVVIDELGNIWALDYRWFDMGSDFRWTVFDHEGRYLGQVVMPYPLTVHQIGADYVLGHMSNGRGGEAVYIYGLNKPEAGAGG